MCVKVADELIERSRKLLEGITPGPWQTMNDMVPDCMTIIANVDGEIVDGVTHYSYDFIATCVDQFDEFSLDAVGNARLIAAAPTLIAEQATVLEQLQAENERLRGALTQARNAIVKAAQDTLWCDDEGGVETVVDRIDWALQPKEQQP